MLFWSFHAREDRQRIHKGCKKTMKSGKRSWQLGLLPGGLPEKVTLILSSGPAYTETGEGRGVAEGSGMDQQESPRQRLETGQESSPVTTEGGRGVSLSGSRDRDEEMQRQGTARDLNRGATEIDVP